MRTITLELLRHGVAHNQLVSPLVPYLALCENHPATTVYMPFEHNQLLHRLKALNYDGLTADRNFQINQTGGILAEVLSAIPGLTTELSRVGTTGTTELTNLRLIISASELALLPFELALTPSGCPGTGQHLLLQPQVPITLTRETRRVPSAETSWLRKPRVLFASAAPTAAGPIPLEAHLLALRQAIDPWVAPAATNLRAGREVAAWRQTLEQHLVLLPNASARSIQDACATGDFTHIHLLAHGREMRDGYDIRYGLALEGEAGGIDVVSGERLATIVRAARRNGSTGYSTPTVVTLATCNAGSVGSVAGAGASVAHALHAAGVPVVIAGQFPLSFEGSVRLVEVLYGGLLSGLDPRRLLHDLRRRLHSEMPERHDWASLVAYATIPPGIVAELEDTRIRRAYDSVCVALEETDRFLVADGEPTNELVEGHLSTSIHRIAAARDRLGELLEAADLVRYRGRILGLLASTEKRQAEMAFSRGSAGSSIGGDVTSSIIRARDFYWQAFREDRSNVWGAVQALSLSCLLRCSRDEVGEIPSILSLAETWKLASALSTVDCYSVDTKVRLWAYANLIELNLLATLPVMEIGTPTAEAVAPSWLCRSYLHEATQNTFEVSTICRQLSRYVGWYDKFAPNLMDDGARATAKQYLTRLQGNPPSDDERPTNTALSPERVDPIDDTTM